MYIVVLFVALASVGPYLTAYSPAAVNLRSRLHGPTAEHWFGADHLGRDLFSRVAHGARMSLAMVLGAVAGAALVGGALGLCAAYGRGYAEMVIMRLIDVLLALPGFLIALVIIAILGVGTLNVVIAVAIYSIPIFARVAHAATLSVCRLEYVEAIRSLGATSLRVVLRHLLPNILSPLLVQASLRMATALLMASSLSFLGLGVQPPSAEWGSMIAEGRNYMGTHSHIVFFPGAAIMLVTLGLNLLGDGLRDALDPRLR